MSLPRSYTSLKFRNQICIKREPRIFRIFELSTISQRIDSTLCAYSGNFYSRNPLTTSIIPCDVLLRGTEFWKSRHEHTNQRWWRQISTSLVVEMLFLKRSVVKGQNETSSEASKYTKVSPIYKHVFYRQNSSLGTYISFSR